MDFEVVDLGRARLCQRRRARRRQVGSTFAAPIVAERALPAVWLTPLFDAEPVLDAIRRATAPALFVGGTADPLWDSTLVSSLGGEVLELAGVDRALEVDGDPLASLDALRRATDAIDGFVARLST